MKYTFDLTEEEIQEALQVMRPSGYKILAALPKVSEKVGNIFVPEARKDDEEQASIMARVIAFGDICYADKKKFPSGPWCTIGDVVLMGSYTGRQIGINGREYRLINDDSVIGVVNQPEQISRICHA